MDISTHPSYAETASYEYALSSNFLRSRYCASSSADKASPRSCHKGLHFNPEMTNNN